MSGHYPTITIDTRNPDPTSAINAFLWTMSKARELGMTPPTEHSLAAHLFRGEAKVIFYSSMRGVMSIVMDDSVLGDDDDLEFLKWVAERKKIHLQRKREGAAKAVGEIARLLGDPAASAGEAGTAETAKTGSVHEHATAATSGGDARKDHP